MRPDLVIQVIADNQAAGVEPAIWKVEGLETAEAARPVAAQMRSGGRELGGVDAEFVRVLVAQPGDRPGAGGAGEQVGEPE